MEIHVLNAVRAWSDGQEVNLGHARQRHVLAALLFELNRPVSIDQLIDRVWGERAPRRVTTTLHSYVSRLRPIIGGLGLTIVRRAGGYVCEADPEIVDVHRFRRLVEDARAANGPQRTADLLLEALATWQGDALDGADTTWFNQLREILGRELLSAELALSEVMLELGREAEILAMLRSLTQAQPFDERVAGRLMLTLHRQGRTVEALDHYQDIRSRLDGELGLEPGAPLQRLHQQILSDDSALANAEPEAAARTRAPTTPTVVPRQLPAQPRGFTGRNEQLALLSEVLGSPDEPGGTAVVCAIGGIGGIGKTWLALRWAHEHHNAFPDGQLYVNLRGFDPGGEPVPAHTAVRGFLEALGTDVMAVPAEPDAQAALYRSLTADKRLLIVLDNARDTAQVAPLLPGSPTCTVVVTSRSRLAGLTTAHGARPVALDVLTDIEARHLLTSHLGADRTAAEPEAVATLLEHCAGLPLALSILAARATLSPDVPLAELAGELHETHTRLDALDSGDLTADLRTVFASSYHVLEPDAAQLFRLLGRAPGPDISLPAAAGLTALPVPRVRVLLRRLQAAHLVQEHAPGRYRMHDLTRLYAAERARAEPAIDSGDALLRLVDFYLHTAHAAASHLDPHRDRIPMAPARPGAMPEEPADLGAALAWFTVEHPVLLDAVDTAVGADHDRRAWLLAHALETYFDYRGHCHDWAASQHTALDAARRLADRSWQAGAHRSLGSVYTQMGRLDVGHIHFRHALDLYIRLGDQVNQAHTHRGLGWVCDRQGSRRDALAHNEQALALYRQAGHRAGQAKALNNTGWLHIMLGDYRPALDHCAQAVDVNQQIGDRHAEAGAWDSLGYAHHHLANYSDAITCYERALALDRGFGDQYGETEILRHLGDTRLAAGDTEAAGIAWRNALEIAEEIDHPAIEELHSKLDSLTRPSPGPREERRGT
ncbi:AfsR/SARP family transcriptional regulator [Streptomyces kanamyceticus]|uniref:AfsR/SARP family transcriptional regulator n=1 Tax=Streptomyces kanamyceticus TaxID=1967 RepID=UPI000AB0A869|nr:BTAD domain-containing putative transcriptional regulator [Streptomyces kanamyceticus]